MKLRSSARGLQQAKNLTAMLSDTIAVLQDTKDIEDLQRQADAAGQRKTEVEQEILALKAQREAVQSDIAATQERYEQAWQTKQREMAEAAAESERAISAASATASEEVAATKRSVVLEAATLLEDARTAAAAINSEIEQRKAYLESLKEKGRIAEADVIRLNEQAAEIETRKKQFFESLGAS